MKDYGMFYSRVFDTQQNIVKTRVRRSDWNYFKKKVMELYIKILKFPGTTILCTGDRKPEEKQKLTETTMDLIQYI